MIGLILQARMNSRRLPGKVMSLVNGAPLISHVISQCCRAYEGGPVIVCTSEEASDDPIFEYCQLNRIPVYRGSLNDVYARYVGCIDEFGLTAFGRICCDSPGISDELISLAINTYNSIQGVDLVTNVFERTFPVGQSIEIVNAETFKAAKFKSLDGFSKEHVTQTFYHNVTDFKICNIKNLTLERATVWAVDEPGDLQRVSELIKTGYKFDKKGVALEVRGSLVG